MPWRFLDAGQLSVRLFRYCRRPPLGVYLLRAKRPAEALEEARLAARRDPRLFLPPLLEALAHAALGQTDAAKISLASAQRLRPELTLREVEISHGRRSMAILADLWAESRP